MRHKAFCQEKGKKVIGKKGGVIIERMKGYRW